MHKQNLKKVVFEIGHCETETFAEINFKNIEFCYHVFKKTWPLFFKDILKHSSVLKASYENNKTSFSCYDSLLAHRNNPV